MSQGSRTGNAPGEGIIQVYTGNGKGKTTAAWGQALRAAGRGWRIAVVRFLKPNDSGEMLAAARLAPDISIFGHTSPYDPNVDQRESAVLREESRANFVLASEILSSAEYELVVLDEMNVVLHYGFVETAELLDVLRNRAPHVHVVITGRYAPDALIEWADLVTEMRDVKHPADTGMSSRAAIEF